MHPQRLRPLNTHEPADGPVLYWMNRDMRLHDNWALAYAQQEALKREQPLLVVYNLDPGFLGGGYRQHQFKLAALRSLADEAERYNLAFGVVVGGADAVVSFTKQHDVGEVVTDMSPLKKQRAWADAVAKEVSVRTVWVDAHNIVPVWVTSEKQEYAARTIRPKLHKLLPEYLDTLPTLAHHPHPHKGPIRDTDWAELERLVASDNLPELDWITPGERAAKLAVRSFIDERLKGYDEDRNNALVKGQSDLSPYLHYGMVSAQYIVHQVLEAVGRPIETLVDKHRNGSAREDSAAAFVEELVVRRELADNFCFYNDDYDTPKCFPDWATESHRKHAKDKRDYIYSLKEFEEAATHDALWNAAQTEMVRHGKMHGYMRMYWAKKILEWTPDVETAMDIAITLNDRYEIDGRDPNGYTGIAWSLGGVHDRPWFERPVFGTIRYMAESGVAKRFSVDEYCKKWLQDSLL